MRILDTSTDTLRKVFDTNFFSHVSAAHALMPALAPDGVYVGINGGLADFVIPNRGPLSMTQSALRTLYAVLAQEAQDSKAQQHKTQVRLLELYGLVATDANRAQANDGWITDNQVAARLPITLHARTDARFWSQEERAQRASRNRDFFARLGDRADPTLDLPPDLAVVQLDQRVPLRRLVDLRHVRCDALDGTLRRLAVIRSVFQHGLVEAEVGFTGLCRGERRQFA